MRTPWLALLVLLPLGAAFALAQDKQAEPASAPIDDPMMAKMAEFGATGPAHELLAKRVGKWDFEMIMYQPDGTAAEPTQGTSEARSIMEGRFIEETIISQFMGMAFNGRGTTGFDNLKQRFVSTWIDNMGTAIYHSEGTHDAATNTFHFEGLSPDLMAGEYVTSRWTETWTDDDHIVAKGYKPGPDGEEYMEMELHYTRAR